RLPRRSGRVLLPDSHRQIATSAGQTLAVRAKGHAGDFSDMAFDGKGLLAAGRVPDSHRLIPPTRAGQSLAVWTKGQVREALRACLDRENFLPRSHVPKLYLAEDASCWNRKGPTSAGQPRAVGAKGQALDRAGVPAENTGLFARYRVPNLHRLIVTAASELRS